MAVIRGGNAADTLNGGAANDYIFGQLGNDVINGGAGRDQLSGNEGNDRIDGGIGDDAIYGGTGIDVLIGGDGDDYIDGGRDAVKDALSGGAGDDQLVAYAGDVADGGADDDTLILSLQPDFEAPAEVYKINLQNIGGATAVATGFEGVAAKNIENANVSLYKVAVGSYVLGAAGDDIISVGQVEGAGTVGVTLRGWTGDDIIFGSDRADTIMGDAGTDQLYGAGGVDQLFGGAGADLFVIQLDPRFPGAPAQAIDVIRDWDATDFFLIPDETFQSEFVPSFYDANRANPLIANGNPVANSNKGQFLYDTDNGRLSYDPDGTGSATAIALFTITGAPTITASDFIFDLS